MRQRICLGDVGAATVQRKDQFHLVMVVICTRCIGDIALGHDQCGRAFGEIERGLAVDNRTHFGSMRLVIAANAENPVYRVQLV